MRKELQNPSETDRKRPVTHRLLSNSLVAVLVIAMVVPFIGGCASKAKTAGISPRQAEAQKRATSLFIEGKSAEARGNKDTALGLYLEALQYDPRSDVIALAIAKVSYETGRMKTALKFARMAAGVNPTNTDAWRIIQYLYQREDDLPKAAEALETYIRLKRDAEFGDYLNLAQYYGAMGNKDKMRSLLIGRVNHPDAPTSEIEDAADFFKDIGFFDEAESLYRRMVEKDPSNVDAWVKLGDLYSDMGRDEKALDTLKRSLERNPGDRDILVWLGNITMKMNDWDTAISYYQKAREAGFNAPKILMTMCAVYYNAKRIPEAEALRDSIIAMGEDTAGFYFSLGKSMNYLERYQDAVGYYKKGLEKPLEKMPVEDLLNAFAGYIKALIRQGAEDEAVRVIHEDAPKFVKEVEQLKEIEGIVYMELKRYNDAIEIYKWLSDSDPENPRYVISLSQAYNAALKYNESEKILLEALKNDPDNTRFLMQIGIVYDATKQFEKAESTILRVLKAEPENSLALNNLAYMYIENGKNIGKAITMVKKALSLEPDNGAFLDTLGWGLFRQGKFAEAKSNIEQALKFSERQDKGVIYDHYGDVLSRMGMQKEAGDAWRQAIEFGEDKDRLQKKIDSIGK